MNPWRWKIGLVYIVIGILLAGVSALVHVDMEKFENLPAGSEVSAGSRQEILGSLTFNKTEEGKSPKGLSENTSDAVIPQSNPSKLTVGDFPSPVKGRPLREVGNYYSEAFQAYLFHAGVDYAQPEGAVIRATHGGKVIFAGADPLLGQKVTLDCGDGWSITYGGLDNLRVKEGEVIEENDAIGQVGFYPGAEGVNDQPQLHYEVWHGDEVALQP